MGTSRHGDERPPATRALDVESSRRVLRLNASQYETWIGSPHLDEAIAGDDATALVIVSPSDQRRLDASLAPPGSLPVIVCWVGDRFGGDGPSGADLVITEDEIAALITLVERNPMASVSAALLLRTQEDRDIDSGLTAESAVYSMLQAGPEFAAWRAQRSPTASMTEHGVVVTERDERKLTITLDRPHRHNAITAQLRDELAAALAIARADDTIDHVVLRGAGPSFCSGGDLDEFGSRVDPVTAHLTRLARSPGRDIARLDKVTVIVHGTTIGGGIEMAAFAEEVVAHPMTTFALPEVSLGLIPGAGGTVSLTRRIGRQRTAALAITGRSIDAATALEWGLIDEIDASASSWPTATT